MLESFQRKKVIWDSSFVRLKCSLKCLAQLIAFYACKCQFHMCVLRNEQSSETGFCIRGTHTNKKSLILN